MFKKLCSLKIRKKIICGPDTDYGAVNNHELYGQILTMSREDFEEKKLEFLTILKLNKFEIDALQHRIVEQANCEEWVKERFKRLITSNFGKVCKLRKTTFRKNSLISILYQSHYFHGTTAIR
jgi:hypothetical protein